MAWSNDAGQYLRLSAVNELLEAINEDPASALDTSGTGEVAIAEQILDAETYRQCVRGWDNINRDLPTTVDSSGEINIDSVFGTGDSSHDGNVASNEPAEILWLKASGPDRHRKLGIRNGKVYDRILNTTDLRRGAPHSGHGSGAQGTGSTPDRATVFLTVKFNLSFENCSASMQEIIIAEAAIRMIHRYRPEDERRKAYWRERLAIAQASFGPEMPREDSMPDTLGPVVPVQNFDQGQR